MNTQPDLLALVDKLDVIAADIAKAGINGFGNQVKFTADEIRASLPDLQRTNGGELLQQALTDPENQPSQWGTIPLSMIPERMDDSRDPFPSHEPDYEDGVARGWNACLDRITGQVPQIPDLQRKAARHEELLAFANSFKITVTDSYYKDAYLAITRPDKSCVYRLPTPSTMSDDLAEIERMRVAAIGGQDGR